MHNPMQEIPDPPGDWVLADEPGECIVSLTKKYKDESILVEMNINDQVRSSVSWIPPRLAGLNGSDSRAIICAALILECFMSQLCCCKRNQCKRKDQMWVKVQFFRP